MLTLSGLLEGLERDPGVVAFSGSEPLSSHDFLRRVGQFRHLAGPRKEKRWGLYLQNPFDFAACFLALLQAGKVPVILPNSRPSFCEQISDELDAVIADSSIEGLRTLCLNDLSEDAEPNHGTIPKGSRLALFTSGSTGRPKKVEKSLFNIASELQTLERVWGTDTASSTFLSTVSHQHIYGLLFQVLWPLCSRKPFDTRTYSYPSELVARMDDFERCVLVSSPSHLARITELTDLASRRERFSAVFSSGGPLQKSDAVKLGDVLERGVVEVFGSTETGGVAFRSQDRSAESELWTPFSAVEVRIEGEAGSLSIRSPYVDPEIWYPMQDRVEFEESGRFRLLGRCDRVVKVEGKRVSLDEIESRLKRLQTVREARALVLQAKRGFIGVVLVLTEEGKEILEETGGPGLKTLLKEELATYFERVLLPRKWRFVDQLPTDHLGKPTQESMALLFKASKSSQPVVHLVTKSENEVSLELSIPQGVRYFEGHFPGRPVLPGVAQVDWAAQFGMEHFQPGGEFLRLEAVKFHEFIVPNAKVKLTLKYRPHEGKVLFSFVGEGRKHSSGRIVFG